MTSVRKHVHVWPLKVVATKAKLAESGFFVLFTRDGRARATDLADWLMEQRARKMGMEVPR